MITKTGRTQTGRNRKTCIYIYLFVFYHLTIFEYGSPWLRACVCTMKIYAETSSGNPIKMYLSSIDFVFFVFFVFLWIGSKRAVVRETIKYDSHDLFKTQRKNSRKIDTVYNKPSRARINNANLVRVPGAWNINKRESTKSRVIVNVFRRFRVQGRAFKRRFSRTIKYKVNDFLTELRNTRVVLAKTFLIVMVFFLVLPRPYGYVCNQFQR